MQEKITIDIQHHGRVRGGGNAYARLHLHIIASQTLSTDETRAIFEIWDKEFNLKGEIWVGYGYQINTRREFAIVPAIIRKAICVGYDVALSQWDAGVGKVLLSTDPATFWREVALAQMWYEKVNHPDKLA